MINWLLSKIVPSRVEVREVTREVVRYPMKDIGEDLKAIGRTGQEVVIFAFPEHIEVRATFYFAGQRAFGTFVLAHAEMINTNNRFIDIYNREIGRIQYNLKNKRIPLC